MKKIKALLLSDYNKWEDKPIEVLDKYGQTCCPTDLALLRGAFQRENTGFTNVLLRTDGAIEESLYVDFSGNVTFGCVDDRDVALRPVLKIEDIAYFNNLEKHTLDCGVETVNLGEYPQEVASEDLSFILEQKYKEFITPGVKTSLNINKNRYTFDSFFGGYYSKYGFSPISYSEFVYKGQKYVRVQALTQNMNAKLSNDVTSHYAEYYWVKVLPVTWLVDEKAGILISEKALVAGIRYNKPHLYKTIKFEKSEVYKFLNKYMIKEIMQSEKGKKYNNMKKTLEAPKEKEEDILLKQIESNLKLLEGSEDIVTIFESKVYEAISKYNEDISKIKVDGSITLGEETFDDVRYRLITTLETILKDTSSLAENVKKYLNFADYLIDLENILLHKSINNDTDLKKDFEKISYKIIPFLDDQAQNLEAIFLEIIRSEKLKINDYIQKLVIKESSKIEYATIEEFELFLRAQIHPYLILLNDLVVKKDVSSKITTGISDVVNNIYIQRDNSLIDSYLGWINEIYHEIINKHNLTKEEAQYLLGVIKRPVDTNGNINQVIEDLTAIIKDLYAFKIRYDFLEEKQRRKEEKYISFDFKK